jgi:hypothetical protein
MFTAKLLGLTTFVTIDGSILAKRERRSDKAAEIEES